MDEIATKFLKTYQVWHHRRLLLSAVRKPGYELEFIAKGLQEDTKNYHTWAYRQWILSEFNDEPLWATEPEFVEKMIHQDIRNNSAWHHRFFVFWDSGVHNGQKDREALLKEDLTYALLSRALQAPVGVPNSSSTITSNQVRKIQDLVSSKQPICVELSSGVCPHAFDLGVVSLMSLVLTEF